MSASAVSEFVHEKASRLLVSGAVVVTCTERGLVAVVEGDHGPHRVTRDGDRWRCDCPARRTCSHSEAVARVTE